LLVGLQHPHESEEQVDELLHELAELAETLGVPVAGRFVARVRKPQSRYLVGSGKADEIMDKAGELEADVIIFDEQLTPSQQRNWERLAEIAVIDRQEVILDIFSQRAQTKEAELQVSLAQAKYDLPRLKRRWTHLSRQRGMAGGAGLRGEGEQQIEVDARLVRRRIATLEKRLEEVRKQRDVQRKQRLRKPVPVAAIVGYTNAGKSSLLNVLTNADALVEDKLFATLDPTTRRIVLPNKQELLLSDTVGFIRKLPHQLVEAFKSTLEEATHADMLIEVLDITNEQVEEHHETTHEVLAELGGWDKPLIQVFNKTDLVDDSFTLGRFRRRHPDAVFVSCCTGAGMDTLLDALSVEVERELNRAEFLVPHERYDLIALLHRTSDICDEKHEDTGVRISASVSPQVLDALKDFRVNAGKSV